MYKILVVDDEFRVCKMLEKFINKSGLDLQVIASVNNGKDAFEIISKESPDIVVTDIRMPIFDGIELVKRVRAAGNNCDFIFISGYREFEYAHSAISYGVRHYLLKPINKQDFLNSLTKIIQSLDCAENAGGSSDKPHNVLPSATLGIRHSLLKALCRNDGITLTSIEECNRRFLYTFREGRFQVFTGVLDSGNECTDYLSSTLAGAMDNIIHILNKFYAGRLFEKEYYIEDRLLFWLINYDPQNTDLENSVAHVFGEINQMLDRQGDLRFSLAVSPPAKCIQELPGAAALAADALKCRIRIGNGRIIFADTLSYPDAPLAPMQAETVIKYLEADDMEALLTAFGRLLEQSRRQTLHPKYKIDILLTLYKTLEDYVSKYSYLNEVNTDALYKVILTAKTEQSMDSAFMDTLSGLLSHIVSAKQNVDMLPIKNAKEYISAHIDKPLTLLDVADHVHLTPNYFSTLFKNETGSNYLDYLIALRIEKAKELLLTELPLSEVCKRVGYPDVKYFSKIFKKKVGLKPLDYKKFHHSL